MRFRPFLLLGLLLGLTACEDPSNVGLGLIGGEGGEPVTVTVPATGVSAQPLKDVTGDVSRVLAGAVDDPLLGGLSSNGYVDFGAALTTDAFKNGRVSRAVLRLRRNYVYGDTTSRLTYELRRMPATWNAAGASSDTTLAVGAVITTFQLTAADTLVTVALPAAWVAEHDALLRGTTFIEDFHGFALTPVSGNAVVGFDRSRSELRAFAGTDSARYAVSRTLSTVRRTKPAALPAGRIALQDGAGPGVALRFDLAQEALRKAALNNVIVRVYADTTLLKPTGAFARPTLKELHLYGITPEGTALALDVATRDTSGAFTFRSRANPLRSEIQKVLMGTRTIERFELRIPASETSVNPVVLYNAAVEAKAPRTYLTITRVAN